MNKISICNIEFLASRGQCKPDNRIYSEWTCEKSGEPPISGILAKAGRFPLQDQDIEQCFAPYLLRETILCLNWVVPRIIPSVPYIGMEGFLLYIGGEHNVMNNTGI